MRIFLLTLAAAGFSGCGTLAKVVENTGNWIGGDPLQAQEAVNQTASALPFPANVIVAGVGGAVIGLSAFLLKRRAKPSR